MVTNPSGAVTIPGEASIKLIEDPLYTQRIISEIREMNHCFLKLI